MPDARNSETRAFQFPRLNKAPTAADFNNLSDAVQSAQRGVNSPRQAKLPLTSNPPVQMIITANDNGNYLICNSWDGVTQGGEQFIVAKPYLLQKSTVEAFGITTTISNAKVTLSVEYTGIDAITVTNPNDATTEDWLVTLDYNVDDVILAIGSVRGGIDSGAVTDWIDLNVDGRAWAKV